MSANEVTPTIVGRRIVDHYKYILVTKELVRIKELYKAGYPVFICGSSGTHLVGWYLCDWVVGHLRHISVREVPLVTRRGVYIVKDAANIAEIKPKRGVVVEAFRRGLEFGISEWRFYE